MIFVFLCLTYFTQYDNMSMKLLINELGIKRRWNSGRSLGCDSGLSMFLESGCGQATGRVAIISQDRSLSMVPEEPVQ